MNKPADIKHHTVPLWIGGKPVVPAGRTGDVYNPASGQVSKKVPLADAKTVDAAVKAAATALPAWRETPFFSERERAALAWTEAVTLISRETISDAAYEEARRHFSERELVDLTMAIVAINSWNRMAVAFRPVPGSYQRSAREGAQREKAGVA